MTIHIAYEKGNPDEKQIIDAVTNLNAFQHYYYYELTTTDRDETGNSSYVNWESFRKDYNNSNSYMIYITEKPFDDNWFSHEEKTFCIITTSDWEDYFAPPNLSIYLAYQIVQATLNFHVSLSERMVLKLIHEPATGCIFDLCANKPDIKLGMKSGSICPHCKAELVQYGLDNMAVDAIEHMLLYVRSYAIGKPIRINSKSAFVVMRFSYFDENDSAYRYGIKPALEELGIVPKRADNQISSGPLLKKVQENIKNCRFIIAKIDSINLNVYFELGLAMGLEKDVLLIAEERYIPQLPSDLTNWECLTYTERHYDELKEKIKNYFKDNYHL